MPIAAVAQFTAAHATKYHSFGYASARSSGYLFDVRNGPDASDQVFTVDYQGNLANDGTMAVTGNFAVNTNKFTVAAASGDTLVAGDLSVTGALTVGSGILFGDDEELYFGTGNDYWLVYNNSGTQFLFKSTDVDGGGADGNIFSIQDGTDDVVFVGDVTANLFTGALTGAATQVTVADESSDATCFPLFVTAATGDLAPKSGSNLAFNSSTGELTVTLFAGALNGTVGATTPAAVAATTLNASGATTLDGNVTLGDAAGDNITVTGTVVSHVIFTDNTYDIGASGATRPRTGYFGTSVVSPSFVGALTGAASQVVAADESTDTTCFPLFVTAATGSLPPKTGSNLAFNSNTGELTATLFAGALNGTVGATTPATIAGTTGSFSGIILTTDATDATSATAASLKTAGGIACVKDLWVGRDARIAGNLTVSDSGPNSFGGNPVDYVSMLYRGSFTSLGGSTVVEGLRLGYDLIGAVGDTSWAAIFAAGVDGGSSIVTQTEATTILDVATAILSEPGITKNVTTITNASTLLITGAPTEGASNYAILVDSGAVKFGGTLAVTGDTTLTGDLVVSGTGPHAIGGAVFDYIQLTVRGAFSSGGAATDAAAIKVMTTLEAHSGDSGYVAQLAVNGGTIEINGNAAVVAAGYFSEPIITETSGNAAIAATVYIKDAPTEGTANHALMVAGGSVSFGGTLAVSDTITSRHIISETSVNYDLGSNSNWWRKIWAQELSANGTGTFTGDWTFTGSASVSGSVLIQDSVEFKFGNGRDLWMIYNATGTVFEFWSTTGGGGSTDGLIFSVQDGADNVVFPGDVTANLFTGALTGTASLASTVTVADESSDATCFPAFFTAASGSLAAKTGSNLAFNSSTGELTATLFAGALNGTVGATTPAAVAATTVTTSGILSVDDVTDTTSTTTGSIHTDGGVGIAKNLWVGVDTTLTGDLTVSGVGPHVFGGAIVDYVQVLHTGAFSSAGASDHAVALKLMTTLEGEASDSDFVAQLAVTDGTIEINGNAAVVASAYFSEPVITETSGNVSVAATVYIKDAPTEGTVSFALDVAAGNTRLGGNLAVTGATANVAAGSFTNDHASTPHGVFVDFPNTAPNDTTQYFLSMHDSGGLQAVIYSDGSYEGSANSYGALSDLRLKTNVLPMESTWDRFKKLDWISFEKNGKHDYGLGAQPTQEIFPDCVYQSGEYLAINYMGIATKTGRTLQEAMGRIEVLEDELEATQHEVELLKAA